MSNSIERVETPSGATHKTLKGTYMKHAAGAWFEWLHEWVKVDSGVHVIVEAFAANPPNFDNLINSVANAQKQSERQDVPTAVQSSFESQLNQKRNFAELHDKPFTPCRPDVPTADKPESITDVARSIKAARVAERQNALAWAAIDWNSAPKGATHAIYEHDFVLWLQQQPSGSWLGQTALGDVWDKLSGEPEGFVFERPESITEIPYGVKAARVAEQSERTYPHYFKDVSAVDAIDLYHVARLYDITDPALFHAFKKIACAGKRGTKDQAQDVQEAIDALKRWQELNV